MVMWLLLAVQQYNQFLTIYLRKKCKVILLIHLRCKTRITCYWVNFSVGDEDGSSHCFINFLGGEIAPFEQTFELRVISQLCQSVLPSHIKC